MTEKKTHLHCSGINIFMFHMEKKKTKCIFCRKLVYQIELSIHERLHRNFLTRNSFVQCVQYRSLSKEKKNALMENSNTTFASSPGMVTMMSK